MKAPNGLAEIIATFGDLASYVRPDGTIDPSWEAERMIAVPIPFSIPLAWDTKVRVSSVRVHKNIAEVVHNTFDAINTRGLAPQIKTYGGAYSYRPKRNSNKYSTHSWGIAIDLNPDTNRMGTRGDMPQAIVNVFREFGWKWGGEWRGANIDPMHYQLCTGY
jgi:hypothetical protein